jgi:hypothetical protein
MTITFEPNTDSRIAYNKINADSKGSIEEKPIPRIDVILYRQPNKVAKKAQLVFILKYK